jgi:hypothetical protein
MRLRQILLTSLFLGGCTQINENAHPDESVVNEKLQTYYADMSARDWKKYKTHFWNNATITTAWKQPGDSIATVDVTTIDDFIRETPNGPDSQPIFEEKMLRSEIHINGNLAQALVYYEAKFGTSENLSEWKGTDLFTLLRHGGEWKIVSLVFESGQ